MQNENLLIDCFESALGQVVGNRIRPVNVIVSPGKLHYAFLCDKCLAVREQSELEMLVNNKILKKQAAQDGHVRVIGLVKILSEGKVTSTTRRIDAVWGKAALDLSLNVSDTLNCLSELLKVPQEKLLSEITNLTKTMEKNEIKIKNVKARIAQLESEQEK